MWATIGTAVALIAFFIYRYYNHKDDPTIAHDAKEAAINKALTTGNDVAVNELLDDSLRKLPDTTNSNPR